MGEIVLKIEGMHCDGCVKRVKNVLQKMEGIEDVDVSLEEKTAKIKMNGEVDLKEVKEKIENLGFEVKSL